MMDVVTTKSDVLQCLTHMEIIAKREASGVDDDSNESDGRPE